MTQKLQLRLVLACVAVVFAGTVAVASIVPVHNDEDQLVLAKGQANKDDLRIIKSQRSKPTPFSFDLVRSQTVFVKVFDYSAAEFINAKAMSEEEAVRQKRMTAEQLQKRMVDKLVVFRFDAKPFPDDPAKAQVKDALVVDGKIGQITFGQDDTWCTVNVAVFSAADLKKPLGSYDDGGNTSGLADKLGQRFDKTAKD